MTKRLEQAFTEAAKLPPEEQDAFAAIALEELASERRWAEAFAKSPQTLSRLAAEALAEHRAGRTRPLGDDGPPPAVNSHTTESFRRLFRQLPAEVQQAAKRAYRL